MIGNVRGRLGMKNNKFDKRKKSKTFFLTFHNGIILLATWYIYAPIWNHQYGRAPGFCVHMNSYYGFEDDWVFILLIWRFSLVINWLHSSWCTTFNYMYMICLIRSWLNLSTYITDIFTSFCILLYRERRYILYQLKSYTPRMYWL